MSSINPPRTSREALIAEMLGDMDALLARVEAFPPMVAGAEEKLSSMVMALEKAGDNYRMAVTAFNEQAKADLTEYFDRKALEVSTKTADELRAAMQEAARSAFRSEASDKATSLGIALGEAAKEITRVTRSNWIAHLITAFVASGITAALVFAIVKAT